MIVPIRKVIRNKRLLSLLESQFLKETDIGIERIEIEHPESPWEIYRVYTKHNGDNWSRDRFIIDRKRGNGRVTEYRLDGEVYFNQ